MRVSRKTNYLRGVSSKKAKNRKISLRSLSGRPRYLVAVVGISLLAITGTLFESKKVLALLVPTEGASIASKFSPTQEAESYAFYYAMGNCVHYSALPDDGARFDHIDTGNAKNGVWFSTALAAFADGNNGAAFLKDFGVQVDERGNTKCNQDFPVKTALSLWGNWEYDDALCAFGFVRADGDQAKNNRCTDEQGGNGTFGRQDTDAKMYTAVKDRVYGGSAPTLSGPAKYLLYLKSFKLLCAPNATITTTKPTGTTDRDYAISQVSGTGDSAKASTVYYVGNDNKTTADKVNTYNPQGQSYPNQMTCGQIASTINGAAASYAAYLKQGGQDETADSQGDNETNATTCGIEGVGYLICPVSNFLSGIADGFYNWIAGLFLDTDAKLISTQSGSDGAYKAWQSLLVIANIIFVVAFLFIIFSQATGYGISNYGVKKMLPKIIIGAILINLSFYLCQALVDISNLLGYGLHDLFKSAGDNTITWQTAIGQALALQAGGAITVGAGVAVTASLVTGVGVVAVIVAVVILLLILLFLIAQKVLIVLCVVISPIAFAAWLLPNTEKFFKYWWKIFYAMLIVFPLTSVIVGASGLAADIIRKSLSGS